MSAEMGDWCDHPAAPPPGTVLCAIADIPEGGGRPFHFDDPAGGKPFRLFVVRQGGHFHAYVNACAHFGVPLNVRPDHGFLSADGGSIVCQVHYARYGVADGRCLSGDCEGDGLVPVPLVVREGLLCIGD